MRVWKCVKPNARFQMHSCLTMSLSTSIGFSLNVFWAQTAYPSLNIEPTPNTFLTHVWSLSLGTRCVPRALWALAPCIIPNISPTLNTPYRFKQYAWAQVLSIYPVYLGLNARPNPIWVWLCNLSLTTFIFH
jgi:hypothetical protein